MRPQAGLAELVRRDRVGAARSEPSVHSTRDASRSNSTASSLEMPRWRSPLCGVRERERERARRGARIVVLLRERLGRLAIRRHARSRSDRRTIAPGGSRIRCRRLTIGSSTMPVGARQRAAVERRGSSGSRPRPRNRARSVSHSTGPCGRPSRLRTWKAHDAARRRDRGAGDGRAAPRCRAGTRFRGTACRTPGARDRRPAAPGRSRRSW